MLRKALLDDAASGARLRSDEGTGAGAAVIDDSETREQQFSDDVLGASAADEKTSLLLAAGGADAARRHKQRRYDNDDNGNNDGDENPIDRSNDTDDDEDYDDDEDDDDEEYDYDEDWDDDDDDDEAQNGGGRRQSRHRHRHGQHSGFREFLLRVWKALKGGVLLVVDVENLWDSTTTTYGQEVHQRRNHYVVLLWFVILATSYTLERTSFKLLVDRTGPFRLLAVEMVTLTHALMIGSGMLISAISRKDFTMMPLGIPFVDCGLMALLDTIASLLMYITGFHVAPTLTVILIQFTIPLTALISQFVHKDGFFKRCCERPAPVAERDPDDSNTTPRTSTVQHQQQGQAFDSERGEQLQGAGGLSKEHVYGSIIIGSAVLLALCPSIYTLIDEQFFIYADEIPMQTAVNTLVFCGACIPIAASQLYKEHIMLQYKQPVQPDYLNLVLSLFQAVFIAIMSPLVFSLLGLAGKDNWSDLYPSSDFSKNFAEGFECFLGLLDHDQAENGYPDEAVCSHSLSLVFLNSFSMIAVGVAVDKIVKAGATKVMYRGVSGGIILAVISLYLYDLRIPDFSYGAAIDSLNLVCLVLLVIGSEVYHRVSLQDATFETIYPEVEGFYFDDVE